MYRTQTVSVSIAVSHSRTCAFAADPANLPAWAPGFVSSIEQRGGHWIAATTLGEAKFRFAPPNPFGVIDHDVEVAGEQFHNPMRVIPNGEGSEVQFTLMQLPGVDDEKFAQDVKTVTADLGQLKKVLELRYGSAA
jgi:hypothetical protein